LPGMGKGCWLIQAPRLTPPLEVERKRSVQSPWSLHICAGTDGHEFSSIKQTAAALLGPNTPHEMLPLGVLNDAMGLPPYAARLTGLPAWM